MNRILYHGSEQIIETPQYGKGFRNNDYGRGFYLTEEPELAKEWACSKNKNGFLNKYEMDVLKFVQAMNEKIKNYYQETNLKRYRKIAELSQKQLADLSGVPVRQIQLFEQRQRDINKTQEVTLWRMGKVLGCTMEELLEI